MVKLTETNIDIVDIGRGFLVNPNWANYAKEGLDTGKCLNCAKCGCVCAGKVLLERNIGQ